MALTDESGTGMVMPVAPMYGGGNYGGGFGSGFGGDGWWIILLFILLIGNNGWGNNFGGGYGGGTGSLYPWMNQAEITNSGFQNRLLNDNITSIRDGITGLSTQLCNGFSGTQLAISNGFAQAEIANNARQMADMNQMFGLQSTLQNCCCENRAGLADLKYTVATEACADRAAVNDALRDVIAANTASTQRILDQLCQDKIDEKNDTINQLRQELLYARGQASQDVQTATLRAGQVAEVDALYDRLNSCPISTVPVYGRQPIFTCGGNYNGGCGCSGTM